MAVVRVKRHCNEEPIDALLLACKRRKTENDNLTSVFKFAATVDNQDENVYKYIPKAYTLEQAESSYKKHKISNITDKLRAENRLFSQHSRLKVVNCFRALSETDSLEDGTTQTASDHSLTIVDIESLPTTSSESSKHSTISEVDLDKKPEKYVYDIYYAPDCKLDEKMMDNPISCHPLDDLVFEDYSNEVYDVEEESDDSNDENNWRNDYPDEDPDSIGEDDMKLACQLGGLNMSDTHSLSSDAGEEDLVYGIDEPECTVGIDSSDADFYGYGYAAYKKRVVQDLDSDASENSDFYFCDSDIDSDRSS
ncbi:probable RNA polymerase II nuclear localization protein SLC7A6OS isoform X1 [Homalodisca vitripennis]|uniref:probable RNA polymerase II nuclear localization protein SLC7A6OS isoform X1 n=1 Tax=Homalodisca vitripennis TaxID=197043 RepID=UPI001EEAD278|nr:probable RNA polymerase II nuclear localization protein SLC7A6OS isoform X1 [Homalodisca vitripennis]